MVEPAMGAASFNCSASGGVTETTPAAFVVIIEGVGDSPNSDFNDEHPETNRHTEAASVATANNGERIIFIPDFYFKGWPLSNCQLAGARSREASESDAAALRDWFLVCGETCKATANFRHQTPLRKSSVVGLSPSRGANVRVARCNQIPSQLRSGIWRIWILAADAKKHGALVGAPCVVKEFRCSSQGDDVGRCPKNTGDYRAGEIADSNQ